MRADRVWWRAAVPAGVGALYLLLAGSLDAVEAGACAGVVLIACLHAWGLVRFGSVELRPTRRAAFALARGYARVGSEMVPVGRALVAAVRRRPPVCDDLVLHQPFPRGNDAGRRAACVLALSLAPNGFAIGDDPRLGELLLHQLVPAPPSRDAAWPP